MKIAIHAKELEVARVDGTRSYMSVLLKEWQGQSDHEMLLYHGQADFDPAYGVGENSYMQERRLHDGSLWTQTQFACALWREKPDVLWMPLHNLPRFRRASLRTVVTIHDLAFKKFPETFPASDRRKHNVQTAYAVRHADRVIAVSEATKRDILAYYPETCEEKIVVIRHGIDASRWQEEGDEVKAVQQELYKKYDIQKPYMIFVGGIQPRKNLVRAMQAFAAVRDAGHDMQMVLVGGDAWLAEEVHTAHSRHSYADDIYMTGCLPHAAVVALLRGALLSVYVPLYEGFGLPILEGFAAGVPVLTGDHSSLAEVAGDAAHICDVTDIEDIAQSMIKIATDTQYSQKLKERGLQRVRKFTWERCSAETLKALTRW